MNPKPIHVLHLIPSLSSGGAERQLVNLVQSTSANKLSHTVCVIGGADFFGPQLVNAGFEVIDLGIFSKHPFFRTALQLRSIIKERRPDIVHTWLYDANIAGRMGNFVAGRLPTVTSLQLPDYDPEAIRSAGWNPLKSKCLKYLDRFTASFTKPYFVACSEFVHRSYITDYGIDENRIQVIYNSVKPDLLAVSPDEIKRLKNELALPPDAFIYLNVARLDPQKNHGVLFQAFKLLLPSVPNAYLLLAGVGGMDHELRKLAADLELSGRILFLGQRKDVAALMELADVFVFPSFFEGLPVALIEAMFKSLPCIVSRIAPCEEVVSNQKNGLVVDPHSVELWSAAMLELYENEALRGVLGSHALETVKETFGTEITARQWETAYVNAAGRRV
jgi:glycosyltransferase involved in cell wall biosynthesis